MPNKNNTIYPAHVYDQKNKFISIGHHVKDKFDRPVYYSSYDTYKERTVNPHRLTKVYRNLNRNGKWYSLMQCNKIVAHSQNLILQDCSLDVNRKGNHRVRREKQKNVHAFISGYYVSAYQPVKDLIPITYNPYTMSAFQTSNGIEVLKAEYIIFNQSGVFGIDIN